MGAAGAGMHTPRAVAMLCEAGVFFSGVPTNKPLTPPVQPVSELLPHPPAAGKSSGTPRPGLHGTAGQDEQPGGEWWTSTACS